MAELSELARALGPAVSLDEPMSRHTTLHVGGRADLVVQVRSAEELRAAVSRAWEAGVPCRVLGAGSNVLVGDRGIRGLVVLNRARGMAFDGTTVRVESGAVLSTLARQCVARGLAGMEWAVGIPGTVGGAVIGNAGAWGGSTAARLLRARVLDVDGTVVWWPVERLAYGYRTSVLKRRGVPPAAGERTAARHPAVLEAEFALEPGERKALEARVVDLSRRRRASQPPGASCGSVFRNPPDDFAGRLIEATGLKGYRLGGAHISEVHANFIITNGTATAAGVKALIDLAAGAVHAQWGTALELEIELVGEW